MAALSLVERGGQVRSFQIDNADSASIKPIVDANLAKEGMLTTDEASYYGKLGKAFKHHFTVEHGAGEYVRGSVHANTLEGYFSIFKRGMKGVYQHCSERHLHRYLAEFDFRYNKMTRSPILTNRGGARRRLCLGRFESCRQLNSFLNCELISIA
jgi:hypothetical protein